LSTQLAQEQGGSQAVAQRGGNDTKAFVKIPRLSPGVQNALCIICELTKSACYQPLIAPSAALQKNNS
jgi:hypothetical protein